MLRTDRADALIDAADDRPFLFPDYRAYGLANVTPTLAAVHGIEADRPLLPDDVFDGVDTEATIVVHLVLDGLGFQQWRECWEDHSFLERVTQNGTVTPITSVFPSTTSAAMTAIHTGLTPQEHGLPEWTVYYPDLDEVIHPLPYRTVFGEPVDEVVATSPDTLLSGTSIYTVLAENGVKPIVLVDADIVDGTYSDQVFDGAEIIGCHGVADTAVQLRKQIEQADGPTHIFAYIDAVDMISHRYGPLTAEYETTLATVSHALERELIISLDADAAGNTLLVVNADHGQIPVDPAATVNLYNIDGLQQLLQPWFEDEPVPPTGSPRDVFLHVQDGKVDEAYNLLTEELDGHATILRSSDALENGWFGLNDPDSAFRGRIGDILILPHGTNTVWFEDEFMGFDFNGHHGGLHPDEMLIPFAAVRLSDIQ